MRTGILFLIKIAVLTVCLFVLFGLASALLGWGMPFQALRALIWVALALPVIRMMKGAWRERARVRG